MDVADVLEALDLHTEFALLAGDVLKIYVLDGGGEAAVALLALLVDQIDFEHGLVALAHLDVAHEDVLDDAAAARVGLDADHAVKLGRVHDAVLDKEVLESARDLAAHDDAAVAVLHAAVAHDDVLGGDARRCVRRGCVRS